MFIASYCLLAVMSSVLCVLAGNGGHTLVARSLARQLGLVDESGWPRQAGTRSTTVRGVVEGASERVPLMSLTYLLRGMLIILTNAV
jgi:hypothetical protein